MATQIDVALAENDEDEPRPCYSRSVTPQVAEAARRELANAIAFALLTDSAYRFTDRAEVVDGVVVIIVNHEPGRADQVCELAKAAVEEWLRQHGVQQP